MRLKATSHHLCDFQLLARKNFGERLCGRAAIAYMDVNGERLYFCSRHTSQFTKPLPKKLHDFGSYKK